MANERRSTTDIPLFLRWTTIEKQWYMSSIVTSAGPPTSTFKSELYGSAHQQDLNHTAAIVGCVIAGMACLTLLAIVIIMLIEHRRKPAALPSEYDDVIVVGTNRHKVYAAPRRHGPSSGLTNTSDNGNNGNNVHDVVAVREDAGGNYGMEPGGGSSSGVSVTNSECSAATTTSESTTATDASRSQDDPSKRAFHNLTYIREEAEHDKKEEQQQPRTKPKPLARSASTTSQYGKLARTASTAREQSGQQVVRSMSSASHYNKGMHRTPSESTETLIQSSSEHIAYHLNVTGQSNNEGNGEHSGNYDQTLMTNHHNSFGSAGYPYQAKPVIIEEAPYNGYSHQQHHEYSDNNAFPPPPDEELDHIAATESNKKLRLIPVPPVLPPPFMSSFKGDEEPPYEDTKVTHDTIVSINQASNPLHIYCYGDNTSSYNSSVGSNRTSSVYAGSAVDTGLQQHTGVYRNLLGNDNNNQSHDDGDDNPSQTTNHYSNVPPANGEPNSQQSHLTKQESIGMKFFKKLDEASDKVLSKTSVGLRLFQKQRSLDPALEAGGATPYLSDAAPQQGEYPSAPGSACRPQHGDAGSAYMVSDVRAAAAAQAKPRLACMASVLDDTTLIENTIYDHTPHSSNM